MEPCHPLSIDTPKEYDDEIANGRIIAYMFCKAEVGRITDAMCASKFWSIAYEYFSTMDLWQEPEESTNHSHDRLISSDTWLTLDGY